MLSRDALSVLCMPFHHIGLAKLLVRETRVELVVALSGRQILSLLCLPIPPLAHTL